MGILWYVVRATLSIAIDVFFVMMLIRAIMSWISPMSQNRFMIFIHNVTEFVISPVRDILSRFEFVRRCPIDLSFTVTWLLLLIIQYII